MAKSQENGTAILLGAERRMGYPRIVLVGAGLVPARISPTKEAGINPATTEILKRGPYGLKSVDAYRKRIPLRFVPSRSCFHNI